MHRMSIETTTNAYERGWKDAYELFEKAVERFMLEVSFGRIESEVHACDFFAEELHKAFQTRG